MKRGFIFLLCVVSFQLIFADKIKGIVIDINSRLPIPFSTITYTDSEVLKGVVCDVNGRFEIPHSNAITILKVSCLGYGEKNSKFTG